MKNIKKIFTNPTKMFWIELLLFISLLLFGGFILLSREILKYLNMYPQNEAVFLISTGIVFAGIIIPVALWCMRKINKHI